ncbi:hypothetical protein H6785_02645 [Candidatus Nomurabacteria bacterium]|nr:hypothetical protein [Candidatus Kaiserbacteria bacterium]MCB9815448.1 hypothetical protein [Candidatus Nomurabacteria bacterium]
MTIHFKTVLIVLVMMGLATTVSAVDRKNYMAVYKAVTDPNNTLVAGKCRTEPLKYICHGYITAEPETIERLLDKFDRGNRGYDLDTFNKANGTHYLPTSLVEQGRVYIVGENPDDFKFAGLE